MKKSISVLVAAVLAFGCIATACGNTGSTATNIKVGIGVHTDLATDSQNATTDKNGIVQANIHVAAVMVDQNGKIVNVQIDAIEVSADIDANGKILTDLATSYQTKYEQGTDYGMLKWNASDIGKEWFDQVDYFEKCCIGKTKEQINALSSNDGVIISGCTINISGMQQAVTRAMENAIWDGASATDTLGLGIEATINDASETYNATADKDGKLCANVHFVATTTDNDSKITCVVIDAIQAKYSFNASGSITSDIEKEPVTKYNQKEGYGMIAYGGTSIDKEWYQQAEFIMQTIKHTNAAIKTTDKGTAEEATVLAGCTIVVTDMNKALEKALHPTYTH